MLIGLSGRAGSGKNTVADALTRNHRYQQFAFATKLKQAALQLNPLVGGPLRLADLVESGGWEAAKARPEVRQLLQRLGTEVGRGVFGEDFWISLLFEELEAEVDLMTSVNSDLYLYSDLNAVITDVRFPNEAAAIKRHGGHIVRVQRPNTPAVSPHIGEIAMDHWSFDGILKNDGDLDDLGPKAHDLLVRLAR